MNTDAPECMAASGTPLIRLNDVSYAFDRRRQVLAYVNLSVCRGDVLLIEGPNGGGKTTLLRLLLGLLRPTSGSVTYLSPEGNPVKRLSMGYLPQKSAVDSRFPITVRDVVASALLADEGAPREAVAEALRRVKLTEYASSPIGSLSGGQVQRALLARAIVACPEVLILDEPLSYLDEVNRRMVRDIVATLKGRATIIIVTHEPALFTPLATRCLYVNTTIQG